MDASRTLGAAQQLIQKFRRQAAVWRNLVGQSTAAPEPVDLADLVDDFISLMETEARVTQVHLAWERCERPLVLDDVQALSQRLLTVFLNAMQVTPAGGRIAVVLAKREGEGVVMLGSRLADGSEYVGSVAAPFLR